MTMMPGVHWRADIFAEVFPDRVKHGAGFVRAKNARDEDTMFATWMGGNDYQNASPMYGAYPKLYLGGAMSLFPDARRILHLFSGSLTKEQVDNTWAGLKECSPALAGGMPTQIRFDNGLHPAAAAAKPDVIGDAQCLVETLVAESRRRGNIGVWKPMFPNGFDFDVVIADPPYRLPDQRRYWRESMHSLEERCRECNQHAALHYPRYQRGTHVGALIMELGKLPHEYSAPSYVRFKPLRKKAVILQTARVIVPGGYLVWLDEIRPPYDNERWIFRGGMTLLRSTNHRVRYATLLERRK